MMKDRISEGDFGPYVQSERLPMYKEYADQLVDLGGAHYCFCGEEEIEKQRKEAESLGISFKYDDPCKHVSVEEARERIAKGGKICCASDDSSRWRNVF